MQPRAASRAVLVLSAAGSIASGCGRATTPPSKSREVTAPVADRVDAPSLTALADRLDPGPVPGLLEGMPPWVVTQ